MLDQLRRLMVEADVTALWITRPENVRYLTGFSSPQDARVLVTLDGALMYTDARYAVQAQEEARLPHHIARGQAVLDHARDLVAGHTVGFEADALSYAAHGALASTWGVELRPLSGLVERLRLRKSPEEVALIRRAAGIADEALEAVLPQLKPGAVERDIALALEFEVRRRGAHGAAFEFIVASGPRGAMPHGVASDRVLGEGELVTIDFGAVYKGYHSDMTRTYPVGGMDGELAGVYRAVAEAQAAALARVRPGARCVDVDAAAREVIAAAGYGEAFVHSTGHGVGLAIHEGPTVSAISEASLEAGMVVTIEPGVYLPGLGGVRIEDLVLVTQNGGEALSGAPKAAV